MKNKNIYPLLKESSKLIASALLGFIGAYLAFSIQYNASEKDRLNDNSNKIIEIEMQYPYVIDSVYIQRWSKNTRSDNDSSMRYQSYCEYLFDYVESICEYYGYNKKKIDNYMDMPYVIGLHKIWWRLPEQQTTDEPDNSEDFYKFRDFVNSYFK